VFDLKAGKASAGAAGGRRAGRGLGFSFGYNQAGDNPANYRFSHSLTQDTLTLLHSEKDVRTAVNDQWHHETYRLVAALAVWLDGHFDRYGGK